jgi:hypothetical protein
MAAKSGMRRRGKTLAAKMTKKPMGGGATKNESPPPFRREAEKGMKKK